MVLTWLVILAAAGLIVVNGATDAPNSLAVAVGSGALSVRAALRLAAIMEATGLVAAGYFLPRVTRTVLDLSVLPSEPGQAALALAAAMAVVVIWALLAWWQGLPTSESHGLLAALAGAAIAGGGWGRVDAGAWAQVGLGLVLSLAGGWGLARWLARLQGRRKARPWRSVAAAAILAAGHGAQDGQKFLVLFLLALDIAAGRGAGVWFIPLWLLLLVAALLALGVLAGGRRILHTLSYDLIRLDKGAAAGADLSSLIFLMGTTLFGLPVSTTHIRVAALAGAGREANPRLVRRLLWVWLLTFPACAGLAWIFGKAGMWMVM